MRDRRRHIRRSQLRQDRTITVGHQAVDYRLRVDQNVDPVLRHREQVMRLDYLQPFVHHRR